MTQQASNIKVSVGVCENVSSSPPSPLHEIRQKRGLRNVKDIGEPQQTKSSNKDTKKATTDTELAFTRVTSYTSFPMAPRSLELGASKCIS